MDYYHYMEEKVAIECMYDNDVRKNRIEEALEVAAQAHNGQYRKGTQTPYISHPYAVGLILMNEGCSEEVVIAGILHDTVEDTDLTLECIKNRFGHSIAEIVDGCSEDKSLRWRERKTERIEALKTASAEVCLVTCADKLHNLRTVISEFDTIGDVVWERFHGGIEAQAWYYRSVLDSLQTQMISNNRDSNEIDTKEQVHSIIQQLQLAVTYLFDR